MAPFFVVWSWVGFGESDSQNGYTALTFAAICGCAGSVRLLIDVGADKHATDRVRRRSLLSGCAFSFISSSFAAAILIRSLFTLMHGIFSRPVWPDPPRIFSFICFPFLFHFWSIILIFHRLYLSWFNPILWYFYAGRLRFRLADRTDGADVCRSARSRGLRASADRCRGRQGCQRRGSSSIAALLRRLLDLFLLSSFTFISMLTKTVPNFTFVFINSRVWGSFLISVSVLDYTSSSSAVFHTRYFSCAISLFRSKWRFFCVRCWIYLTERI